MVRRAKELTAIEVRRLDKAGRHAVGGVYGLYLDVNGESGRSWVYRVMVGSKRRAFGLGPYPEVGLAQARDKAREMRALIDAGVDPIKRKHELRSQLRVEQEVMKTFRDAAQAYLEAHADTWKNAKHRVQWSSTLETYVYPKIGDLLVRDVDQVGVLSVLEPIWKTKNETASRVRGRIEAILDWSKVRGYRTGENPATWKGHLDKLLPAPNKVAKTQHHRALDFRQMADFMSRLQDHPGIAARALEFAILCAARSGEVRNAVWSEIDFKDHVWIVPAERMKAGKEHRVPLSTKAIALLKRLPRVQDSKYVFPGRTGGPLSDMSLIKVVRDMKVDAVPHGFRSTLRDWVGEETNHPRELAEQALAHVLVNKVEAAYRRGDALQKRRVMMEDWARYCFPPQGFKPMPPLRIFRPELG